MKYNEKIIELLELDKKILKIYDNLIKISSQNNKRDKEFLKQFNNLDLLIDYENEKLNNLNLTNEEIDFYLKYNPIDFKLFNSEILKVSELYKYRLFYSLLIHDKNEETKITDDDVSELYLKYIWNIEKDKNKTNQSTINKIQFYNCYINKTIENFFLDNIFSFNKEYKLHLNNYNNNFGFRLFKLQQMNNYIIKSLDNIIEILMIDPDNIEYIYYKNFIKSVISSSNEEDVKKYMLQMNKFSPVKGLLLNQIINE